MIQIKLPTSISYCRPDQLTKWLLMHETVKEFKEEDLTKMIEFRCGVISLFSDIPVKQIKHGCLSDINEASEYIFNMLANYEYKEPKGRVTINGVNYVFEHDIALMTTGQIIDLKLIEDIPSNPYEALAICYIEEGMNYCHEDERGRIKNPNYKRAELFKKQFDGEEFLNFFSFFLHDYEARKNAILGIQYLKTVMMTKDIQDNLNIPIGSFGQDYSSESEKNLDKRLMKLLNNRI